MREFAVVGSGIGGANIAAYLHAKGFDTILFEKEPYLGGCSSTFRHGGFAYNTGATTLAGYQDGQIVKQAFDAIGFTPQLIASEPAIIIYQNGKETPRYQDLEHFLSVVEKNYPHKQNRAFWTLIHGINEQFFRLNGYYYANTNIFAKIKSLTSFIPLGLKFGKYFAANAHTFIDNFFEGIRDEYLDFLEAQILIVAQARTKEINFFTAALALGYTFSKTHYVVGGFSQLFDDLLQPLKNIERNCEITSIVPKQNHFELHSKKETFLVKKLILNSTVYDSAKLFESQKISQYYKKYEKLNNHQSSFMLYMTIKSDKKLHHHYQIIKEQNFPHTISKALFISVSDQSDNLIAPLGHYSITASIHTDFRLWENKKTYKEQKNTLKSLLTEEILAILGLQQDAIVHAIAATPKTFARYIKRNQLGGNAITMKNLLPFLPGNDTPIKNLYNVGDTVYAAQGWPGVMMGVENLKRVLHV